MGEVAGGCFCCRFSDFLDAALTLRETGRRDHPRRAGRQLHRRRGHSRASADARRAASLSRGATDRAGRSWQGSRSPAHARRRSELSLRSPARRSGSRVPVQGRRLRTPRPRSRGCSADGSAREPVRASTSGCASCSGRTPNTPGVRFPWTTRATPPRKRRSRGSTGAPELILRTPAYSALVVGPLMERLDAALTAVGARIVHVKVLDQTAEWIRQGQPMRKRCRADHRRPTRRRPFQLARSARQRARGRRSRGRRARSRRRARGRAGARERSAARSVPPSRA